MKHPETDEMATDSTEYRLPIAYIRTDSLLASYKYYIDLNEAFMRKYEDKRVVIKNREDKLRKDIEDFYQRAQANAFFNDERRVQEQNRLAKAEQDLQKFAAQAEQEFALENAKNSRQLQESIKAALDEFNTPRKYEIIFSDIGSDNILFADKSYDITQEIIEYMNSRYVPKK